MASAALSDFSCFLQLLSRFTLAYFIKPKDALFFQKELLGTVMSFSLTLIVDFRQGQEERFSHTGRQGNKPLEAASVWELSNS